MYGINAESINWFKSYLGERQQKTKVYGMYSEFKEIPCGVPQGSILGPLLFIIYINDLTNHSHDLHASLYADDTTLYCFSNMSVEIVLTMQIELETVNQWFRAIRLTLNTEKTKFIIFGNKNKLGNVGNVELTMNNERIERVTSFKYLGIIMDDILSFEQHIDHLYKKCCQKLGAIGKVRDCLNKKLPLQLYKSLVSPHLHYGDVIYMSANKESLAKLQLVQNKACRLVLRAHRLTSTDEMHKELQLMRLEPRREFHLQCICHTNIYYDEYACLSKFFEPVGLNHRTTRASSNKDMKVPNIRSTKGRMAIRYKGPVAWNKLGNVEKSIEKYTTFKPSVLRKLLPTFDDHPT